MGVIRARGVRSTLCGVLSGLAVLASASAAHPQTPPRAERPTYQVGERWILTRGVYELVRIEKGLYVFAANPQRQIYLTTDLLPAKMTHERGFFEWDPPPKLPWPLEVGKTATSTGLWTWQGRPGAGFFTQFKTRVAAYEDFHVPAGRFGAFKIEIDAVQTGRGESWARPNEFKITMWYAPEVRQIIRMQGVTPRGDWGFVDLRVATVERTAPRGIELALQGIQDNATVDADRVTVEGKVTSASGIAEVTVSVNGAEVARRDERKTGPAELSLSFPLRLKEGRNVVLVSATDRQGATRQEARVLFYDKPAAAAASPPEPPRTAAPAVVTAPKPPVAAAPPKPEPKPDPPVVVAPPRPEPRVPEPTRPKVAAPSVEPRPTPLQAPLAVALASPADKSRSTQESTGLAGIASSGRGVTRVLVTLNGIEVSRLEEKTPPPSLPVNLAIKLREGQNLLVVTAIDAAGGVHQEVRSIDYEKPAPLTVTIRYPEDKARVADASSVVAALVTSSRGVQKVSVTLNGMEVAQESERAAHRSLVVTTPVTLKEGANAVVVTATEPDGTTRQEVRTIFYDAPKVAAAPPVAEPKVTHDRWAVVIGIGQYESPGIPRLRYTVPDAQAIHDTLVGPAGFKKEHVLLLTDKTERKPTVRNIRWALGTFLSRSAKKSDTVLIFFAGHGAPEVDPRGVERDGLAKYLIPSDADPEDLYSTALPMDELQTIFARIESDRVVAFLDACYSGAAGGRTFAAKKTRAGSVDDLFLERLTRSKGRAIVTASRTNEVSLELPDLGHGIFTYYLVEGLKGAADANRDGIVSLQELYEYVEQQVTQKSRAAGGNQHPVMKGELEGSLPLVTVGKTPAAPERRGR